MNRLLKVIIAVLAVWVLILSIQVNRLSSKQSNDNGTTVVENHVEGFSTDLTQISEKVQSSLVLVKSDGNQSTGVIYAQDGETVYVVTNYHAVENGNIIQVMLDNFMSLQAEVMGYDERTDVAVLKVNCKFDVKPIKLGDSSLLKSGQYVVAFGNPLGIDYRGSLSFGIVSSNQRIINTHVNDQTYLVNMIQSDVTLNKGNSGGPLCNENGEMVGLNTFTVNADDADDLSFSLPVNEMKLVVDQIIETGFAHKVNLGLKVSEVSHLQNYQKNNLNINLDIVDGLYVSGISVDFLGSYLGINEGDIILQINDHPVNTIDEDIRSEYSIEQDITVLVLRQNEEITLQGSLPND